MLTLEDWAFIKNVEGWMSEPECRWLAELAATVTSWTEIGVHCGRSAIAAGLYLKPEGWLQLVDIYFQPGYQESRKYLRKRRPDLRIVEAECDSAIAARHLPHTDVVFIDGEHAKDGVLSDIDSWTNKCKIMCGHDYDLNGRYQGVVQAVDERFGAIEYPVCAIWCKKF